MSDNEKYYLRVGKANDLKNPKERLLYRALEIFPGFFSWGTLGILISLSYFKPVWIAVFIIVFDIYWLTKAAYLAVHLVASYRKMKKHLATDWMAKIANLRESDANNINPDSNLRILSESTNNIHSNSLILADNSLSDSRPDIRDIYHLVILPMYKEDIEVVRTTFLSLADCRYPKDKMIVVLATEERAGQSGREIASAIQKEFGNGFFKFLITCHPADIAGEIAGKGSNQAWAAKTAKKEIIDALKIPYENIIVSVFDIDTCVKPDFFACLTYHYLATPNPTRHSFQPIPTFYNNYWQAPVLIKVVSTSSTFWHMMQQERPERSSTFSSHSMSFKTLVEIGFWQTNVVSEDSRIFWQCFLFYDGDYRVVPLYYPVSMDACVAKTPMKSLINQYKQQRRWGWGAENIPYIIFGFFKNKKIPFDKKLYHSFWSIEGFHSWATNALIIALLGWLPLFLGGEKFNVTVFAYNLPIITRTLGLFAMIGLITSSIISTLLLPKRPPGYGKHKILFTIFKWALLPVTLIIFGAFPGLDAQTRLMLGKYMGFWVTEKTRIKSQEL